MGNRALVALVTVVIAVFGIVSLRGLQQELAPSISFPQVAVVTTYPGASPEVVNTDVSTPLEAAIQGVPDLESTSAASNTNTSIITAKFAYGTDIVNAEQKVTQAVNRVKAGLPSGLDPQVVTGSLGDLPVLQVAVTSTGDADALAAQVRDATLPEIGKLAGVREASLLGAQGQRVTITPDPAKLAAARLSTADLRAALQQNGTLLPGGDVTQDGQTLSVRTGTKLSSVADIAALPVTASAGTAGGAAPGAAGGAAPGSTGGAAPGTAGGAPAATPAAPSTIGAVASVALGTNPVTSLSYVDGKPALTIAVTKLPAANTVSVSTAVRDALPQLQASLQGATNQQVTFTTVFDQAPFIQQSVSSLAEGGALGLVFAVIVILLFLMSVRATLVTAISIPTSVLITFIGLQTAGYTLNILTLGALTIAIGRVVDDSIVVIENIKRHLELGQDRTTTVLTGVREVAGAITASTLTTVAVFLPIAFVGGIAGELFRPFALTVTIALLASLLVALTIVPVLAYWFLRPSRARRGKHEEPAEPSEPLPSSTAVTSSTEAPAVGVAAAEADEEPTTALQRAYLPVIHWTLKHSVVTLVLAFLVLVGTGALLPLMKTNFLGSSGQNTMTVTQQVAPGTGLDAQRDLGLRSSAAIKAVPGVETVQFSAGASGSAIQSAFLGAGGTSISYSLTTDEGADQDALQTSVRQAFTGISQPNDVSISTGGGFGGSSDIIVDVRSSSQDTLRTANDALVGALGKLSEVSQVKSNLSSSQPFISVDVDRTKAAEAGLSEVAVGTLVSQTLQPTSIGTVAIDNQTLTIYLAAADPPATIEALSALPVPTARGPVPLSQLASVKRTDGPVSVTTERGLRTGEITVTPGSDNLGTASSAVQQVLTDTALPEGVTATVGGATADQNEAFSQLGLALVVAVLVVYVIMVATFGSLLQPLLLLVSIPFAATGAILLQVVTRVPLGVPSLIGVLMLIGIVVTNAIVLVDLVNQYRERGMHVDDAVVHGAARRLRPILMTALATIFALVPMALGLTGHGGFISQPLAIVVIGGLLSSTVLTLVVLPTLYALVERARERRRERGAPQVG